MPKIYSWIGLTIISMVIIMISLSSCEYPEESKQKAGATHQELIFAKGEKVTNDNFTGTVYLKMLINADSLNQTSVGNVSFEPGARTRWHLHPAGQILLVTYGIGYYQEKGQVKKILRKGETVKCPPGLAHWHGASVDSLFVQIAITGREKGETVWLEHVTDEEYNK